MYDRAGIRSMYRFRGNLDGDRDLTDHSAATLHWLLLYYLYNIPIKVPPLIIHKA